MWDMDPPSLTKKLKQLQGFTAIHVNRHLVVFLGATGIAVCGCNEHKRLVYSLMELQKSMFVYYKSPTQSNEDCMEAFEAVWVGFEAQGGYTWKHLNLIKDRAVAITQENGRISQEPRVLPHILP